MREEKAKGAGGQASPSLAGLLNSRPWGEDVHVRGAEGKMKQSASPLSGRPAPSWPLPLAAGTLWVCRGGRSRKSARKQAGLGQELGLKTPSDPQGHTCGGDTGGTLGANQTPQNLCPAFPTHPHLKGVLPGPSSSQASLLADTQMAPNYSQNYLSRKMLPPSEKDPENTTWQRISTFFQPDKSFCH